MFKDEFLDINKHVLLININIHKYKHRFKIWGCSGMNKYEIIEIIRQLNPEIEIKYNARVNGVFGSFVRGEEGPESDLDVLVDFKEGANLLDLVGLSIYLEEKLDIPVDVVPVDTIRKEIKKQVMKEAISI